MAVNTSALKRKRISSNVDTSALRSTRANFAEIQSRNEVIRQAPEPTFREKIVSKIPQGFRDILFGRAKEFEGLTGRAPRTFQEELATGGILKDNIIAPFITRSETIKRDKLQERLIKDGTTPSRAFVISQTLTQDFPSTLHRETAKKKLNLTQREQKSVTLRELAGGAGTLSDVVPFVGQLRVSGKGADVIAKTRNATKIEKVLTQEIQNITKPQAEQLSKALVFVDDSADVQKVINRTDFALNKAGTSKVNTTALQTSQPPDVLGSKTFQASKAREVDSFLKTTATGKDGFGFSGTIPKSEQLVAEQRGKELIAKLRKKTGQLTDLTKEARKFKTAEEFVEAQITRQKTPEKLGATEIGSISARNFLQGKDSLGRALVRVSDTGLENQLQALTRNPDKFVGNKVSIFRVVPAGERINAGDLVFTNKKNATKFLEDHGIKRGQTDIVEEFVSLDELSLFKNSSGKIAEGEVYFTPNIAKTKSQLTEIFNQANKTTPSTSSKVPTKSERALTESTSPKDVVRESSLPKPTIKKATEEVKVKTKTENKKNFNDPITVIDSYDGKFTLPEETKFEGFRRSIEDYNIRLKVLNDKIRDVGGKDIADHVDLWAQKDMLPRVQSNELEKLNDIKIDFVKRLTEDGIDVNDFDKFLHARHATERNARMNRLRVESGKETVDGLSGMKDAEATAIIKNAPKAYNDYASEISKMLDDTLKFEVKEGLMKPEEADIIRQAYKNYVPLYRDIGDDFTGVGSGISVVGKETKRARGGLQRVTSPIGNAFYRVERARVRALKNRIGKSVVELTKEFPFTKDLFKVEAQQYVPRFNADGELQFLDPKFKFADNVLGAKIDGKQYFITISDKKIAQALKNQNLARIPRGVQFLRTALGIWSSFKTRLRPEFLITNFQRDLGEALLNLGVEKSLLGQAGRGLRRDIVKDLFPAQRMVWKHLRGTQKNAQIQEFFDLGGDTGHFWLETHTKAEKSIQALQKELQNKGLEKVKNPIRKVNQLVNDINTMVELGVRYSTYKNLIARGMSKQKAIQSAADLTVNFSRQGEISPLLKTFYGFINPAIQGSSKVIRATTSPQGRRRVIKGIVALATLGFMTRALSMMIDPEGDEQINDWAKNHRLTFATGGGNTVTLWQMPYGFTSFYALGSNAAEIAFGKKTVAEGLSGTLGTTIDSFSPFGTSLFDMIPTLAKPVFEVNQNEGWHGGNIRPDQVFTDTPKPNSETYFNNTSEMAIVITEFLNNISGGGDGKSGLIDVSPNDLEYLYNQYLGGPFEFTTASIEAMALGANGEFDKNKTPFVRQFIRDGQLKSWSYGVIYDTLDRAYRKNLSDIEVDRFYRAIETGATENIFDQARADTFIRKFVKAQYRIEGDVDSDTFNEALRAMPKDEQDKFIGTYAEKTQERIRKELATPTKKPSGSALDRLRNLGGEKSGLELLRNL